jgi:hypothetical protein
MDARTGAVEKEHQYVSRSGFFLPAFPWRCRDTFPCEMESATAMGASCVVR